MRLFDGVDRLRGSLDYHLARHNLLASNMSQVDTPGFRPVDLRRTTFDEAMANVVATTDPRHLGGAQTAEASRWSVEIDRDVQTGLDGNGVDLEKEAVKIASNQIRYDVLASLTTEALGQLAWAAADGRGG